MLEIEAFRQTPLVPEPFEHLILPRFVKAEALDAINRDYPVIEKSGSFPLSEVSYGPAFAALVEELNGDAFRKAFEEKFGLDLSDRPVMITARGRCSPKDGKIHTDSVTKIITVLIYMNPKWEESGGRLRLLRSGEDLEDYFEEVPPEEGTLLAFRRSDNSFHGHKSFSGSRRAIQLNWVTDIGVVKRESSKHRFSAFIKRLSAPRM
jgi:hypothetical protein